MSKLLRRATVDLEAARSHYRDICKDELYRDMCCYHIQQSIEKSLKYVLEKHNLNYKYKHDIEPLLEKVKNLGVQVPEIIENKAQTLNSWESESRYNDNFFALSNDIEELMLAADTLINTITKLNFDKITKEDLYNKIKAEFLNVDDIENLINKINASIPPNALNMYGANKIERVYNFMPMYKQIFGNDK